MCGIVGYVGRQNAVPVLLEGLARLEYRGYDSAGVAVARNGSLRVHKQAGKVRDLAASMPKRITGNVGIAHTRWATHGLPTDANAHPHLDMTGRIAVVHNGIIENAAMLRGRLEADGVDLRQRDRHRGARPPDRRSRMSTTSRRRSAAHCARSTAPTAWRCSTPSSRPDRAGAQRQPGADRRRRPPDARAPRTWPRSSATPSRSCTSRTASSRL